ncbi:uncharacterized protein LOC141651759 [Silene latifolia]|uniref:uncharacterized protein LOC141651759 n=1 Tax=Silene latifolia TaxID=37657 RepID=UPI003D76E880
MEYLSRILADITSRGDRGSISIILRVFATFSAASSLTMNNEKSEIYFNCMAPAEVDYILHISGFKVGIFPFSYLCIPISYKRMAVGDCTRLVEKVVGRIRSWGARKLSYDRGSLQKLPLVRIRSILEIPNSGLGKICNEKRYGGLDIANARLWNKAFIGKYTWWLASKFHHMWIKWVDHVYMEGRDWQEYTPTTNSSWTWHKICQVKDTMKAGYVNGNWSAIKGVYSVSSGCLGNRIRYPGSLLSGTKPVCIILLVCWLSKRGF